MKNFINENVKLISECCQVNINDMSITKQRGTNDITVSFDITDSDCEHYYESFDIKQGKDKYENMITFDMFQKLEV